MRVLVTGANGQLGFDVVNRLEASRIEYLGTDKKTLDLTNEQQVKMVILTYLPDVVIHCAAYTAVDKAEDEKDLCYAVNVLGTRYVAEACKEINAKMVYISTDYVFDGKGSKPISVTDEPNPINYYGKTKLEGELEVQKLLEKYFIVRVSWLYGVNGNNFVKTMLKLGKEKRKIYVVGDQYGSPTNTHDLAALLIEMIYTQKYSIYHVTNEGFCSWYQFACEIFRIAKMDVSVYEILTEEYPTRAKRPKNSRLSKDKLDAVGFKRLPSFKSSIEKFLESQSNVD